MRETSPAILAEFIKILRETGNVSISAKACGYTRVNFYNHKTKNPEFAKAWEDAYEESMDKLEFEAVRRAKHGVEEAMMFQGRQVGVRRVYSDRMLEFLLTGGRPEKYAHRFRGEITGKGGSPLVPEVSILETARRVAFILIALAILVKYLLATSIDTIIIRTVCHHNSIA